MEVEQIFEKLRGAIEIAMLREGAPNTKDGGVLGLKTGVVPATKISEKSGYLVVACAYGGTNWVTTLLEKQASGHFRTLREQKKYIPNSERQLSFEEWIKLMAGEINQTLGTLEQEDIERVVGMAISFGFPHHNTLESYGVDGRFARANLPKYWEVTNFEATENNLIGASILEEINLAKPHKSLLKLAILNDTNAVANDLTATSISYKLPLGFVFGTGSNACINDINLEINSFSLENGQSIEMYTGGAHLKERFLEQIQDFPEDVKSYFVNFCNSETISALASLDASNIPAQINEHTPELQNRAKKVLTETGKYIGIIIAATIANTKVTFEEVDIPIEGAVYWKAYNVAQTANEVVRQLLPNIKVKPYKAFGYIGMAYKLDEIIS